MVRIYARVLWRGILIRCGRVCSDWVKLYLGKKNGAHVLGCRCQDGCRLVPLLTLARLLQTTNSRS